MNKKLIMIVAFTIVAGLLAFFLLRSNDSTTPESDLSEDADLSTVSTEKEAQAILTGLEESQLEQTYNYEEVAEHSATDDCWTVYNGSVYNITEFLPTIDSKFKAVCGQDGSTALAAGIGSNGKKIGNGKPLSIGQFSQLGKYFIGQLED